MTPHDSRPDSPWPAVLSRPRRAHVSAPAPAATEPEPARPVFVACPSRRPRPPPSPPRRPGTFSVEEILREDSPTERERARLGRRLRVARDADKIIFGGGDEEAKKKKEKKTKKKQKKEKKEGDFRAWVKKLFGMEEKKKPEISWPLEGGSN
jgi:hypothetical protein